MKISAICLCKKLADFFDIGRLKAILKNFNIPGNVIQIVTSQNFLGLEERGILLLGKPVPFLVYVFGELYSLTE